MGRRAFVRGYSGVSLSLFYWLVLAAYTCSEQPACAAPDYDADTQRGPERGGDNNEPGPAKKPMWDDERAESGKMPAFRFKVQNNKVPKDQG